MLYLQEGIKVGKKTVWLWLLIFVVLNALDQALTDVAIRQGVGQEANPLVSGQYATGDFITPALTKAVGVALIVVFLLVIRRLISLLEPKSARITNTIPFAVVVFLDLVYLYTVGNNLWILVLSARTP